MSWRRAGPGPVTYRSELVERIRDKGHVLSADGLLTVKLAKNTAFVTGWNGPLDLAYAARNVFSAAPAHLLPGEIIHNRRSTTRFTTWASRSFPQAHRGELDRLRADDVVITPLLAPKSARAPS